MFGSLGREFGGRYHQFARLMEPEKYEAFIQSLKSEWQYWPCCVDQLVMLSWAHTEEKQLRHRIKELMRYRRNGITKLDGLLYFVCSINPMYTRDYRGPGV